MSFFHHHKEDNKVGGQSQQPLSPPAGPPAQNHLPPSGDRLLLQSGQAPRTHIQTGPPICNDLDGSHIYIGSVILSNAVHPCKIIARNVEPFLFPHYSYGGEEKEHNGQYDLLPFTDRMEWILIKLETPLIEGIPTGRRAVAGGYEDNGKPLYHARGYYNHNGQMILVPGKTGPHLNCNIAFGGGEHEIGKQEGYEILCWKA